MKTFITDIAARVKARRERNKKLDYTAKVQRYEKMAEDKFNLINIDGNAFITFEDVRITEALKISGEVTALLFTLRKQFVEDKLK